MKNRNLEDVLKEKFQQHELPANPSSWKIIQNHLNTPTQNTSIVYYLFAACFVGILLAVGILLYRNNNKTVNPIAVHKNLPSKQNKKEKPVLEISQEKIRTDVKKVSPIKKDIEKLPLPTFIVSTNANIKEQILPDSSLISLNKFSTINYKVIPEKSRMLDLKGEAYFHIKPNKSLPFKITSGNAFVEVVGTTFNIRNYGLDSVLILVEEGHVIFGRKDNPLKFVHLQAGDKGLLSNTGIYKINGFDRNDLAWKTGNIVFKNTKMSQAVSTLEDYFKIKIRVSNSSVLNCHVTAKFKHPDLNKVLDLFSALINIKYIKQNNEYILTGKGCE